MGEVVNVVATGNLNTPINYQDILGAVDLPHLRYDPDIHQGLELRFEKEGPLVTVYATGKYIIRANSFDLLEQTRKTFLQLLFELDCIEQPQDTSFEVNNVVYSGGLGREVDLEELASDLQIGDVFYEPESVSALQCRLSDYDATIMLHRTGTIQVVGANTLEKAESAYSEFINAVNALFSSE